MRPPQTALSGLSKVILPPSRLRPDITRSLTHQQKTVRKLLRPEEGSADERKDGDREDIVFLAEAKAYSKWPNYLKDLLSAFYGAFRPANTSYAMISVERCEAAFSLVDDFMGIDQQHLALAIYAKASFSNSSPSVFRLLNSSDALLTVASCTSPCPKKPAVAVRWSFDPI